MKALFTLALNEAAERIARGEITSEALTASCIRRIAAVEPQVEAWEWLDDTRHFGEAANLITDDGMSLREGGLLDSLGLVELVLMLEERFETPIDRELAARPDCQSMQAIVDLVTIPCPSSAAPP